MNEFLVFLAMVAVAIFAIGAVLILALRHSNAMQAMVANHQVTLPGILTAAKELVASATPAPAPARPALPAASMSSAPVAVPAAAPAPMPENTAAQAAYNAHGTPSAAGFSVVQPRAVSAVQPDDYAGLDGTKYVVAMPNMAGFYMGLDTNADPIGPWNVCHFEWRPDGTTVKVMGYATVGPLHPAM